MKRTFPLLLVLILMLLLFSALTFAESLQDTGTVLGTFLEPDFHAKPMTRLWFPDAGAGGEDNDKIEKTILELADKGFGGVEVAMLMSYGVHYTNEESRVYGWGTDNWIRLLKSSQLNQIRSGHQEPKRASVDVVKGSYAYIIRLRRGQLNKDKIR